MLFYRVYYYLNPVATAVHLQAKLSPRPIVDFFTVYPFEVNQSQKLDQVVKGILFRLSDSIACWVTQCGDEVALHLQRENGRGKRAE